VSHVFLCLWLVPSLLTCPFVPTFRRIAEGRLRSRGEPPPRAKSKGCRAAASRNFALRPFFWENVVEGRADTDEFVAPEAILAAARPLDRDSLG